MANDATKSKILAGQIKEGDKELKKVVAKARKKVQAEIVLAAKQGNFIASAAKRDQLYKGIVKQYVTLNNGVDDWTKKRATGVSKAWHALAIDELPSAATKGATFGKFSEKYLKDIIGRVSPETAPNVIGTAYLSMANQDINAIRKAATDVIREGAVTGMTNKELTQEMIKRTDKLKAGAVFVDKAGRKWASDSYFSMLNRTVHANVARDTYIDTASDAGFDLYRIVGGPSSGEADDPCNEWNGEIISMTGATKGYPTYDDALAAGVWHPNCTHSLSVVVKGYDDKVRMKDKVKKRAT